MKNVFVLGLDDLNREVLEALPRADELAFHGLLSIDELQHEEHIDIEKLLERAAEQLHRFDGEIDALVGYWDFPVSSMVPMLCREFSLRAAPLEAVLKCEHKYWSRLETSRAIEEYPAFSLVDPDDPDAGPPEAVGYPLWLKPVKSFSSELAHRVEDDAGFHRALDDIRERIHRIGDPFTYVMSRALVPDEIAEVGGAACLAEEESTGNQVTVEGFAAEGEVHVYGVFDSISYPEAPTFLRYQYPSRLPDEVTARMAEVSRRAITAIGLEPSTFNIEYFWDAERDQLSLLEINPRHSQSHARLIKAVDGVSNHQCMVDIALGHTPELPRGCGPADVAAKWFYKRFADGLVTRQPTPEEIAAIEGELPGTTIDLVAHEGDRLSELHDQDSYAFTLAEIYMSAGDTAELQEMYERCTDALHFSFAD